MIAGIDHSTGDAVICLDSDLQHPLALIGTMTRKFLDGHEIVNMTRSENKDGGIIKRLASSLFYALLNRLSSVRFEPNASDFFLISKRVADVLRTNFRESARFLRGFIQIVGFKKASIEFIAPARVGGKK
jgi:dolichol-phosphate mannosyltransferase